jgi:hypothetical protein
MATVVAQLLPLCHNAIFAMGVYVEPKNEFNYSGIMPIIVSRARKLAAGHLVIYRHATGIAESALSDIVSKFSLVGLPTVAPLYATIAVGSRPCGCLRQLICATLPSSEHVSPCWVG